MRVYECLLCGAIPVVAAPLHLGRNEAEREGVRHALMATPQAELEFRVADAEANFHRFLERHTLLTPIARQRVAAAVRWSEMTGAGT